jgi:hypothetical protein
VGRSGRRVTRSAPDRGLKAVAEAGRRDARRRQVLLVIEGNDFRPAVGLQVALEIGRDVDRRYGLASTDCARRRHQIGGALDDGQIGGCRHLFDKGTRGLRTVLIDNHSAQMTDHRIAEGGG